MTNATEKQINYINDLIDQATAAVNADGRFASLISPATRHFVSLWAVDTAALTKSDASGLISALKDFVQFDAKNELFIAAKRFKNLNVLGESAAAFGQFAIDDTTSPDEQAVLDAWLGNAQPAETEAPKPEIAQYESDYVRALICGWDGRSKFKGSIDWQAQRAHTAHWQDCESAYSGSGTRGYAKGSKRYQQLRGQIKSELFTPRSLF